MNRISDPIPTLYPSTPRILHHAYKNLDCGNVPTDESKCPMWSTLGLPLDTSFLCEASFKNGAGETFCDGMKKCANDFEKLLEFENCAIDFQNEFVLKHCPEGISTCATYCTLSENYSRCMKNDG